MSRVRSESTASGEPAKKQTKKGDMELSEIQQAACANLGILPKELKARDLKSFKMKGLPYEIQAMRYNNHEEARMLAWSKVHEEVHRMQHEAEYFPMSGVVTRRTRRTNEKQRKKENAEKVERINMTAQENAKALSDQWLNKFSKNIEALMIHHDEEMHNLTLNAVQQEQLKARLEAHEIRQLAKKKKERDELAQRAVERDRIRKDKYEKVMELEAASRLHFEAIVEAKDAKAQTHQAQMKKEWESKRYVGFRTKQDRSDERQAVAREREEKLRAKEERMKRRIAEEKAKTERATELRKQQTEERNIDAQIRQAQIARKLRLAKEKKAAAYEARMRKQEANLQALKAQQKRDIAAKKDKKARKMRQWHQNLDKIAAEDEERIARIDERAERMSQSVGNSDKQRDLIALKTFEKERLKQERVAMNVARLERARKGKLNAWEDKIYDDMARVRAFEDARRVIEATKEEHDYVTFIQNGKFRKTFNKMRDQAGLDQLIQQAMAGDTSNLHEAALDDTTNIDE